MELQDLVGRHVLTGVDMTRVLNKNNSVSDNFKQHRVINFILDGITYSVVEKSSPDGYWSTLEEVKISNIPVKNTFEPVQVNGAMQPNTKSIRNNIINFYDVKTGEDVLSVGAHDIDNKQSIFVAEYKPENMCINTLEFGL